jgi:hypothetical protein
MFETFSLIMSFKRALKSPILNSVLALDSVHGVIANGAALVDLQAWCMLHEASISVSKPELIMRSIFQSSRSLPTWLR